MKHYKYPKITEKINGWAYKVHNTLGFGFLEKESMRFSSLTVDYLKATDIEVGLLINFGSSVTVKRRIMDKNKSVKSA